MVGASDSVEKAAPGAASNVLAAIAAGALDLGVAISLAALVFNGPLSAGAGRAATSFLVASAITIALVGWFSRMPVVIAGSQDTAAVVLAAVAASIASSGLSPEAAIATVFATLALSTLLVAIAFWLVGARGLTASVRYLPWPVITGFAAGTGWLLLRGGIEVMQSGPLALGRASELLAWSNLQLVVPGLALAIGVVAVLASRLSNIVASAAIIASTAVFHLIGRSMSSLDELEEGGWLIGPFDETTGFRPIGPADLTDADWSVIAGHALPITAVVGVAVVGLLLNLGGLESLLDTEIDMDHEVRVSGVANAVAAAAGGNPGWALMGSTTLAHQLGARGRAASLIIASLAVGLVAIGPDLIGLLPRAVAGGVLSGLGINLLFGWVRDTLPRHSRTDRLLSIGILVAIAVLGILPGVAIGVITAALLFVGRSSRVEPARHIVAAAGHSNVDRSPSQREALDSNPGAVIAIELQGFLFFGSAIRLRDVVIGQVFDDDTPPRFVVLDFQRVNGTDSTAAAALGALAQRLRDRDVTVLWSAVSDDVREELERNDVSLDDDFADLEHALAHSEDRLLEYYEVKASDRVGFAFSPAMMAMFKPQRVEQGQIMARAGEPGDSLFFVQKGRFSVSATTHDGERRRLRQVMAGAVVGEIAFLTHGLRSADVVADTDAEILMLSRSDFDRASESDPALVIELQEILLTRLAERVVSSGEIIRGLRR